MLPAAFHIYALFRGLSLGLYIPVSLTFLNDHHCPSLHIGLLGTCFELIKFITAIPIGRWADCCGPRWPLMLSGLMGGLLWLLFFLGDHTLYVYYSCTALLGIAEACMSGSLESWITNCVTKSTVTATILRNTSIMMIASIIAGFLSIPLYQYSPLYCCLLISLANFAKAIIPLLSSSVVCISKSYTQALTFSTALLAGVRMVYQTRKLRVVICSIFFVTMACDMALRYYELYLRQRGFAMTYTGYVTGSAGILALLMLLLVTRYKEILRYRPLWIIVAIDIIGAIICYLLVFSTLSTIVYISLTILLGLEDIRSPIVKALLAETIYDAQHKALIFSLFVLVESAGEILAGTLFGYIIAGYGLQAGFSVSILLFLFSAFVYIIDYIIYKLKNTF
ncbi:MAG: MFS transporter [Candidatus Cardinium sp.]|nr:MFS transporter [Candidatus Cardinium sp.]